MYETCKMTGGRRGGGGKISCEKRESSCESVIKHEEGTLACMCTSVSETWKVPDRCLDSSSWFTRNPSSVISPTVAIKTLASARSVDDAA